MHWHADFLPILSYSSCYKIEKNGVAVYGFGWMNQEKITREDVSKQLVTDSYFEPGNVGLKIKQTILVIIAWLLIFIPFIWLAIPFFSR